MTTTLIVAGGITWTSEKISKFNRALELLEQGNQLDAVSELAALCLQLDLEFEVFPDAVGELLRDKGVDEEGIIAVVGDIRSLEKYIVQSINARKHGSVGTSINTYPTDLVSTCNTEFPTEEIERKWSESYRVTNFVFKKQTYLTM